MNKRLLHWAAGLEMFAVVAHAIDAPDHLTEWWGYTTIFIVIAAIQLLYGAGLLIQPWSYDDDGSIRNNAERYARPYYISGIVLSASVIAVYIISRTSGIPFFGAETAATPVTLLSLVPVIENIPLLYCLAVLTHRSSTVPEKDTGT